MHWLLTLSLVALLSCSRTPPAELSSIGDAEEGRVLLSSYGCGTCHHIPNVVGATGSIGPPLQRWASRRFIAGRAPNSADALVRWIMDPQQLDPGNAMPNLQVSEAEARDMAAYLYTLR